MHPGIRYVLYARKSTDTEDKQILSIPAQLDDLRDFAVRMGIEVAEELTESCSAREPGRPVFSKLIKDVEAGKVAGILCWRLDRLARNPVDGGALIYHLGKRRLREIVTPEGTYTGTGDGKFMLSVLFGAATKMTDDLSAGVTRGNVALCKRGRIPAAPPLGYVKIRDRSGFRGAGKVVPDPDRFQLVSQLWREMLTGTTTVADLWRKASTEWNLTTRGDRRTPGGPVKLSHLYHLFRNRFYAGQIEYAGEIYAGEHEPMVSPTEFERVQEIIRPQDAPRPSRHAFLFRGLLRCGHCDGRLLIGETHTNTYGTYVYYRCGARRPGYPRCNAPMATEPNVTANVQAFLERITIPEALLDWSMEAIDWWVGEEKTSAEARVRAARTELAEAEKTLARLTDLVVAGTLADGEYIARRTATIARVAALRAAIANPMQELEDWRTAVRELLTLGVTAGSVFKNGSDDERRRVLVALCPNYVVTDRKTAPALDSRAELLLAPRPSVSPNGGASPNYPSPSAIGLSIRKNARPRSARERAFHAWCSGEDSNLHGIAPASTSSWCVYHSAT